MFRALVLFAPLAPGLGFACSCVGRVLGGLTPGDGATHVPTNAEIKLQLARVFTFSLVDSTGATVSTSTDSRAGFSVIHPDALLTPNSLYTLTVVPEGSE